MVPVTRATEEVTALYSTGHVLIKANFEVVVLR